MISILDKFGIIKKRGAQNSTLRSIVDCYIQSKNNSIETDELKLLVKYAKERLKNEPRNNWDNPQLIESIICDFIRKIETQ